MGKGNAKKGATSSAGRATEKASNAPERRKHARGAAGRTSAKKAPRAVPATDSCHSCGSVLESAERALLVEEEVGRVFCSEECIAQAFGDDIERLEKDYFKHLSPNDLSPDEKERFTHLRWITLEEPDETWRERTLSGDSRYTLIAEFEPSGFPIWSVCICLFLRGEPSFLYLAFTTKDPELVDRYRKGERVKREKSKSNSAQKKSAVNRALLKADQEAADAKDGVIDGLADSWTAEETERAQAHETRRANDVQPSEFDLYQGCLEPTLEQPDEVWGVAEVASAEADAEDSDDMDLASDSSGEGDSDEVKPDSGKKFYHFIKYFPEEDPGVWFVIIARETDEEEQIEICDAFPTRDPDLVERYRKGKLEVGQRDTTATSRTIH